MKVQPSPTSPKTEAQDHSAALAQLYSGEAYTIARPVHTRFPIIGVVLASATGIIAGIAGGLLTQVYGPTFLGLEQQSQRQVVTRHATASAAPIRDMQNSLVSIYEQHAVATDPYLPVQQVGTALLLSNDGWAVTTSALFGQKKQYVAVTSARDVLAVQNITTDPGSSLVFFHIDGKGYTPAQLSATTPDQQTEYIAYAGTPQATLSSAVALHISDTHYSVAQDLASSDAEATSYRLPMVLPGQFLGGAVADAKGNIVGVLDSANNGGMIVWPATTVQRLQKSVLRESSVVRTSLGVHYIDLALTPGVPQDTRLQKNAGALLFGTKDVPAVGIKSPALSAGLKAGDVITAVDGRQLSEAVGHADLIQASTPGTSIQLTVVHPGVGTAAPLEEKIKVVLASIP